MALKGIKAAFSIERKRGLKAAVFFPLDNESTWEKGHGRLERRRLIRIEVTPEEIGLCGCWQIIAVERVTEPLGKGDKPEPEIAYYVTSLSVAERTDEEILALIRGHWGAIENGIHHRRDISYDEDRCRITREGGAEAMATLRNLAIGLYEHQLDQDRTKASSFKSWMRQMTPTKALNALNK